MPGKLTVTREDFFGEVASPEQAYWLGFLAADAGVHGTKVAFCLQGRDRPHLDLFRQAVGSRHRIGDGRKDGCVTLAIRSPQMAGDLARWGVTPRKTGREVCPALSAELLSHFWRGYFDGDGCIGVGRRKGCKVPQWSLSITSASELLIDQFRDWVAGQLPGTTGSKAKRRGTGCWAVVYGGNRQSRRLARLLYKDATVYLGRKFLLYCRMTADSTAKKE